MDNKIKARAEHVRLGREHFKKAIGHFESLVALEGYTLDDWEADILQEVILMDPPRDHGDALKQIMDKWKPTREERV